MALSASVLAAAIKANLLADPNTLAQDNASLNAVCNAIATAVVAHIVSAGVVNAVGTAPPGGGPVAVVGTVT